MIFQSWKYVSIFGRSLKWGQHPLKSAFNIPPWVSLKNLVQIKGRSGCFTMVNHSKEKNMSSFDIFCWWFSTNIADILWMGQRIPVLPIWDGFSTQTKSWDAYHLPTSDSDFATIHSSKELKDEFLPIQSRGDHGVLRFTMLGVCAWLRSRF